MPDVVQESQPSVVSNDKAPSAIGPSAAAKGKARARDIEDEVEPTRSDAEEDGGDEDFEGAGKGQGDDKDEEGGCDDDDIQEVEPVPEHRKSRNKKAASGSSKKPLKTGPLSADALKEVHAFGDQCRARSEALGEKYGKSPGYILQMAGLGFQPSRASNPSNDYSRWWASTHADEMAGGM